LPAQLWVVKVIEAIKVAMLHKMKQWRRGEDKRNDFHAP
jgi:hypothetical protein